MQICLFIGISLNLFLQGTSIVLFEENFDDGVDNELSGIFNTTTFIDETYGTLELSDFTVPISWNGEIPEGTDSLLIEMRLNKITHFGDGQVFTLESFVGAEVPSFGEVFYNGESASSLD